MWPRTKSGDLRFLKIIYIESTSQFNNGIYLAYQFLKFSASNFSTQKTTSDVVFLMYCFLANTVYITHETILWQFSTRIQKKHSSLLCCECNESTCQKLSKLEAKHIIRLRLKWTCHDCLIFFHWTRARKLGFRLQDRNLTRCRCSGYCYTSSNVKKCCWCEQQVHYNRYDMKINWVALVTTYELNCTMTY